MGRIQSDSCDGNNQNTSDHEPPSPGDYDNPVFVGGCEPVEKKLWDPTNLVWCRSCGGSNWLQSFFGYSQTGINITALLCRDCYDLCVVRHTKYAMAQFIMAAYYVATRNSAGDAKYEKWTPGHTFTTQASLPMHSRSQPKLPVGFRKGKLW